jgi:hypothetical protein
MTSYKKPPAAVGAASTGKKVCGASNQKAILIAAPPLPTGGRLQSVQRAGRSGTGSISHSSKASPCPICARTKDGDCRWGDSWIACHSGAAANHLQIGETIEANGQTWYLSRTGGGHSGMAHVYRLHRPGQFQKGRRGSAASTKVLASVVACRQFYAALRPRVHAALRLPHWEYCSPAELRLVADSFNAAQQLIHHLKRARRIDPALVRLLPIALHWLKALGYQLTDLRHFQCQQLSMEEGWL